MPDARRAPPKKRPKRGRPKGNTGDATRARILRAAWECFGARGFGVTTNRDIGNRAGITAAALYQHFDSKTALWLEAVRAAYLLIVPHFKAAIAPTTGVRDGLVALTRAYATGFELEPAIAPFLSSIPVEIQRHPEVERAMLAENQEILSMVIDIVGRGVAQGELLPEDAEGVVSMFLAGSMGLSLRASMSSEDTFYRAVDSFARLIEGTLLRERRKKK
jgi:AcrR family transcriptional regulator